MAQFFYRPGKVFTRKLHVCITHCLYDISVQKVLKSDYNIKTINFNPLTTTFNILKSTFNTLKTTSNKDKINFNTLESTFNILKPD